MIESDLHRIDHEHEHEHEQEPDYEEALRGS